jgi:hypothetical protein
MLGTTASTPCAPWGKPGYSVFLCDSLSHFRTGKDELPIAGL